METELLFFVFFGLMVFALLFVLGWFVFRLIAFLKVLGDFEDIKNKAFYFGEFVYLLLALAVVSGIFFAFSGTFIKLFYSFYLFLAVFAAAFILIVLFFAFKIPSSEVIYFVDNIETLLNQKFRKIHFFGYLWSPFLKLTEFSKEKDYRKAENFLFLLFKLSFAVIVLYLILILLMIVLTSFSVSKID